VTGIVFHAVLAQTLDLKNWDAVGNELVHTIVPVMAVVDGCSPDHEDSPPRELPG
jgi:hypothetical protein